MACKMDVATDLKIDLKMDLNNSSNKDQPRTTTTKSTSSSESHSVSPWNTSLSATASSTEDSLSEEEKRENILLEPYNYIARVPGKNVRTRLILSFNQWLRCPEDKIQKIADVIKMLHNASLLIDDIEDNSSLRRGVPVAHNVYGIAQTINSANYVYFQCMEKIVAMESPEAVQAFTEQLLELHRGQGLDIYWRDAVQCPTEAEYRAMVLQKTGGLFILAVRLMQIYSESQLDLRPLLETLGLYFQIRDDYINLVDENYATKKTFAEDLTEGKFSFPIIHSITQTPHDTQVINILRQRPTDLDIKLHCVRRLKETKSLEYTRQVLEELKQRGLDEISKLGGNDSLAGLMYRLSEAHKEEN